MVYLTIQPQPLAIGRTGATFTLPRARLMDLATQAHALQEQGLRMILAAPCTANLSGSALAEITPDREGFEYAPLPQDPPRRRLFGGSGGETPLLRELVTAAAIVELRAAEHPFTGQAWSLAARLGRKRIWVVDSDVKRRFTDEADYLRQADAAFVESPIGLPHLPAERHVQLFHRPLITQSMLLPAEQRSRRQKLLADRSTPLRLAVAGHQTALLGSEQVITALARLRRLSVVVMLDVIGTGDELPRLRQAAHDGGIADQVEFHGELEGADLAEAWSGCAALVISKLDAGPSAHFAAALARGLPIIAYSGPPEYAQAERAGAALLVPKADMDSLADAILKLHSDRQRLVAMGRAALDHAQSLTLDAMHQRRAALAAGLLQQETASHAR